MRRSSIKSKSTVKRRSLKRGTLVPEGSKNSQKRSSIRRKSPKKKTKKLSKRSSMQQVRHDPLLLHSHITVRNEHVHEEPRRTLLQYDPSLSYLDVLPHLSKIKSIEGPIRYLVMTPTEKLKNILRRNPPIIIGLGDVHEGRQKCTRCDPIDGCYTLYEDELNSTVNGNSFLGYFNKLGEKFQVDFFYEYWVTKQLRKQSAKGNVFIRKRYENESALMDIVELVQLCSMKHTNIAQYISCPYKTMNTHYVDVRKNFSVYPLLAVNKRELVITVPQISDYSEIFDNIDGLLSYMVEENFTFTHFKKIYEGVYKGEKVDELLDLIITRLTIGADRFYNEVFRTNPLMIKYSKVHKQISQLPEELQEIMYTYDIWTADRDFPLRKFWDSNTTELERMSNEEKYEIIMYNLINRMNELDVYWLGSVGVDLYYIARTLKVPTGGNPTQISLVYLGDHHIRKIKIFLARTGLFKINIEVITESDENKCVIVPL